MVGILVTRDAPLVSHLLFADDSLLFGQATPQSYSTIKMILQAYEAASSQMVNYSKSSISFSPNTMIANKQLFCTALGMEECEHHEVYLGLPTMAGRSKKDLFRSIKDRVWSKLSN